MCPPDCTMMGMHGLMRMDGEAVQQSLTAVWRGTRHLREYVGRGTDLEEVERMSAAGKCGGLKNKSHRRYGETIKFITFASESETAETYNDALYARNRNIEELYNLNIVI